MGEYKKTDDDKQACIIEFALFSTLSTKLCSSSSNDNSVFTTEINSVRWVLTFLIGLK